MLMKYNTMQNSFEKLKNIKKFVAKNIFFLKKIEILLLKCSTQQ